MNWTYKRCQTNKQASPGAINRSLVCLSLVHIAAALMLVCVLSQAQRIVVSMRSHNIVDVRPPAYASPKGTAGIADTQVERAALEVMQARLMSKYRIYIAKDGEMVFPQDCPGYWGLSGYAVSRRPTITELANLEFALQQSPGSQLISIREDSPGVKVCFLATTYCMHAQADWVLDRNGRPVLLLEPYPNGGMSDRRMKEIFLHELAHNSAFRMGYNPACCDGWRLSKQLGWKFLYNPGTNENIWAIQSNQGHFYKFNKKFTRWVRCDQRGRPVNAAGQRVRRALDGDLKTGEQMARDARVRPVSRYFPNPMEVLAEGLMFFRLDADSQSELKSKTPELFDIVARFDQAELDRTYGAGRYTRCREGVLAMLTETAP